MIKISTFISLVSLTVVSYGQTDLQLRDPEYLVDQYNQLVAKHNALIEKTRGLISDNTKTPVQIDDSDPLTKMKLNEALAKVSSLESQLSRFKQEELKANTSNQYLDDTNARLRRQLQELKADEQEFLQRNKELVSENRKLVSARKNSESENKSTYTKIRGLELGKSTLQRKANDLVSKNNELSAKCKKLDALNDRLNRENATLNQKIANLSLDKDGQRARLADYEASIKSKDGQIQENNINISNMQDELDSFRNEVSRLSGTEALLNDRHSMIKSENETNKEKIRSFAIENDAMRAEIESLRQIANDMKFDIARKDEQTDNLSILNSELKRDIQGVERANENLRLSESAMKGELSALRSELTSLGIEESRISSEIAGLRDANDLLQSKTKTLESENNGLQNAIDLMRAELVDMNTNEKGLISRVRDIDAQNKALLDESSSLKNETSFFKDKSRQLEIQLNQAIGNERILNENLANLEIENSNLQSEVGRLNQYGTREYENLVIEAQRLQSQIASILGQEQMLKSKLAGLENENYRLTNEMLASKNREQEYSRQLSLLNEDNNRLINQIDSTQRMRLRLRNDIIGVIDQNDQTPSSR